MSFTCVKVIDQELSVPESSGLTSWIVSVQVPRAVRFLKGVSGDSGIKVPVNGATPAEMDGYGGLTTSSLNVVFMFWPEPPRRLNSVTVVPSGPVSVIMRSEINEWVMFRLSVRSVMVRPSVTLRVLVICPSAGMGMGVPPPVWVTICGPLVTALMSRS